MICNRKAKEALAQIPASRRIEALARMSNNQRNAQAPKRVPADELDLLLKRVQLERRRIS